MRKIGIYLDMGMAQGIEDGSNSAINSVNTMARRMIDALGILDEDKLEIHPRIVPVIDQNDVNRKAALLNSLFGLAPSSGVLSVVDGINYRSRSNSNRGTLKESIDKLSSKIDKIDNLGVTYQQNNYSPKALSSAEIYRKTKSQLSKYKNHYDGTSQLL